MKVLVAIICLSFLGHIYAADNFAPNNFATVEKLKGKVLVNGKAVSKAAKVMDQAKILVSDKSFLKLKASDGTTIVVGPKSKLIVNLSNKKTPVSLGVGSLRWLSPKKDKRFFGIKTPNAVLGVRGTDFFVERDGTFDETQMVCFDGEVNLVSVEDKKDSKVVGPGQWGGIGGRYSQKIGEIITLKPMIVDWFKKRLAL